jgi:hypothetical protein
MSKSLHPSFYGIYWKHDHVFPHPCRRTSNHVLQISKYDHNINQSIKYPLLHADAPPDMSAHRHFHEILLGAQ